MVAHKRLFSSRLTARFAPFLPPVVAPPSVTCVLAVTRTCFFCDVFLGWWTYCLFLWGQLDLLEGGGVTGLDGFFVFFLDFFSVFFPVFFSVFVLSFLSWWVRRARWSARMKLLRIVALRCTCSRRPVSLFASRRVTANREHLRCVRARPGYHGLHRPRGCAAAER